MRAVLWTKRCRLEKWPPSERERLLGTKTTWEHYKRRNVSTNNWGTALIQRFAPRPVGIGLSGEASIRI